MIKKLKSFARLSMARKILFFQTLGASFYSFFLFAFFNRYARFGEKVNTADSKQQFDNKKIADIAWAIQAAARYIPWKNKCRHQAYQAKLLCNYYKEPCRIFIGFKKDTEKNEITAHAWTLAGGKIITGLCNPAEYTVQSVYCNKWQ